MGSWLIADNPPFARIFMNFLLFLFVGITLLVLISGLFVMIKGGKLNKKWGNKLMMLRVVAQAIAIGLLGLIFLMGK
jgi:hypothetical protein